MYFAFQHGYRDNWAGPVAKIEAESGPDDVVWTHPYPVGQYYLGDQVEPLDVLEEGREAYAGKTIWIIEDFGAQLYLEGAYTDWIAENGCEAQGDWSNYAAGREWPMYLYRCRP